MSGSPGRRLLAEDPVTLTASVDGFSAMVILGEDDGAALLEQAAELKRSPHLLHRSRGVELERSVRRLQLAAEECRFAGYVASGSDPASARRTARALTRGEAVDAPPVWCTTLEVAERLGCTDNWVRQLVKKGELRSAPSEGRRDVWIDEASVVEFESRRAERGQAGGAV